MIVIWILLALLFAFIIGLTLYLNFNAQFGGTVTKVLAKRYAKSKHWTGKQFDNLEETTMSIGPKEIPGLMRDQLTKTAGKMPEKPIPMVDFSSEAFDGDNDKPKFIWFGHSALLLKINGKNILIDPMLGDDASPVGPVRTRRFTKNVLAVIDKLPPIDALLMTHDHYDHLDFDSIQKLKTKVNTYFVALGVARHLERWGVPAEQITEFDWWQKINFHGIDLTFTPSRHFSGRGLTDRAKTLWGGWVFKTEKHSIYWSGDGGYGAHFKEVGDKFGPFDWIFIECGQYNKLWHQIHNYPEEAVQAVLDAKAKVAIPVHWGGFALALHTWKEPVERFIAEAKQQEVTYCTPKIGQIIEFENEPIGQDWYADLT